jgi:hypothetical protein
MTINNRADYFSTTEKLESMSKDKKMTELEKDILTIVVTERKEHAWCGLCSEMVRADKGKCKDCGCTIGYIGADL